MGEVLRRARQEKGMSIQQVADAIRISPAYLEALEQDRMDPFPAEVYARGFLKSYASYLGLDAEPLLDAFQELRDPDELRSAASRRRYQRSTRPTAVAATISRRYAGASASGFFPTNYASYRRDRSRRSPYTTPLIIGVSVVLALWIAFSHGMMGRFAAGPSKARTKQTGHTAHSRTVLPSRQQAAAPPPGHISLGLRATGYVHFTVTTDTGKQKVFNGEWMPGDHGMFLGESKISLFADRGNNLEASFNGKDLGPLAKARHQVWMTFPPLPGSVIPQPAGSTPVPAAVNTGLPVRSRALDSGNPTAAQVSSADTSSRLPSL